MALSYVVLVKRKSDPLWYFWTAADVDSKEEAERIKREYLSRGYRVRIEKYDLDRYIKRSRKR